MKLNLFNTSSAKESRLPWIDYARGIAIFLVLYRHIFEGIKRSGINIDNYAYLEHGNIIFFSFRIPLFFIISGVFISKSLQKRGIRQYIVNKWKLLLYPYFLWAFIQVTMQIFLSSYTNAVRTPHDYLYIIYEPREIDQFWYLYALFNTSVLYSLTKVKLNIPSRLQLIIGFLMFFLSSIFVQNNIHLGFVYDILHFYVFIALGDVLSSFILNKKNYGIFSSWKLFFAFLPFFFLCQWYFLQTNLAHGAYSYVEIFQPVLFLIIALSGCVMMINVSFILQRYNLFLVLRIIGYHSLYIYLLHVLASSATRVILTRLFGVSHVPLLLALGIFMGLIIPIIFYNLAIQLGGWWLFGLEKKSPRKKNSLQKVDLEVI